MCNKRSREPRQVLLHTDRSVSQGLGHQSQSDFLENYEKEKYTVLVLIVTTQVAGRCYYKMCSEGSTDK